MDDPTRKGDNVRQTNFDHDLDDKLHHVQIKTNCERSWSWRNGGEEGLGKKGDFPKRGIRGLSKNFDL